MEIKKSEKGYPEIVLFDETIKREDYYSGSMLTVTYEQDRNRFNIFLWKGGDTIKKVYGDWDIEEWLFIKADDGKAFVRLCCAAANVKPPKDKYNFRHVFDVLQNHFSGDMKVFHRLKKLMEDQEFPHKFEYYHQAKGDEYFKRGYDWIGQAVCESRFGGDVVTDGVKFEIIQEDITWLFELNDDFETYWVGYELSAEELIVSDYESSKWLLESWGDADLEHYVHIKREHVPAFIAACSKIYNVTPASDPTDDEEIKRVLHEAFTGRRRMIFEVKDILKDNDLPYRFDMW